MIHSAIEFVKPAGKLILITPNSQSFTRHIFGRYWIHSEHPRHLILFNTHNIKILFKKEKISHLNLRTSPGNAQFSALYSAEILQKGFYHLNRRTSVLSNILAGILQMFALIYWQKNQNSGDELIVKVTR